MLNKKHHSIRKTGPVLVLALLFLSCTLAGKAQDFTASASPSTVSVGDQVQVTFSLNGSGNNFHAPVFTDFNILMGPSQSSSMQIINGSMSQSLSFTYILQALKEGSFKIGSATIDVGGKRLASNAFTITVVKGGASSSGGQQGGQQGGQGTAGEVSKNVFLRVSIDKSTVYRGEGIVCSFKLYTRVNLVNYGLTKLPAFNGFWSQEISLPQQLEFHSETLDGVSYKVADIKKMVLFPQRSGNLQLEPMQGEVIARVQVKRNRSNDPYDQFFNDPFFNNFFGNSIQDVKVPLKSQAVNVTVKELPDPPTDFSGAVGKYNMEVTADKKEVKAHNPVTVRVKLTGKGNLKLLDPPAIHFPPDFETYDPKISSNISATVQGVSGSKTFEYLVIPRNEGDYKVELSPFTFFNLDTKRYESLPAPALSIHVLRGEAGAASVSTVSGYSKEDIQMLGKDIRFIKTGKPAFSITSNTIYPSLLFYSLSASPALLFLGLIFLRRKMEKDKSNMRLLRSRRAGRVARKRLAVAKKYVSSGNSTLFLDEMSKALWGFIGDKLQIPVSHLSKESVSRELELLGITEENIRAFIQVLDDCELARFAPAGVAKSSEELFTNGIKVISDLEEQIKS
jgi:hypothetical protein